jgi:hypothetical protein
MKVKRALLAVSIAALVLTIILVFLEERYAAIALIVGALLMGYPEIWSLLARRRAPIDERVRENIFKSIRNGFIFFAITSMALMLAFSVNRSLDPDILYVLSSLFLPAGVVYLFSYLHYGRAEPRLDEGRAKKLRTFLLIAGISAGVFVVSFILHNVISGLLGVEEPVFFTLALLSIVGLGVGIIGGLVIFIQGLTGKLT